MVTAAIRSSTSMIGLDIPLNLDKSSWSMFSTIFLVSATMATVLYTARSWASWYSGKSCHIKQSKLEQTHLFELFSRNFWSTGDSKGGKFSHFFLCHEASLLSGQAWANIEPCSLTLHFANITYFLESGSFLRLCIHNLHLLFGNRSVLAYLREDFNCPLQKTKTKNNSSLPLPYCTEKSF